MQLQFEEIELKVLSDESLFLNNKDQWWEYWYILTDEIDNRGLSVQRDFMRLMYEKRKCPRYFKFLYDTMYGFRMFMIPTTGYQTLKSGSILEYNVIPEEYFNFLKCGEISPIESGPIYSYNAVCRWTAYISSIHMPFYDAMFKCYSGWGTKVRQALEVIL